MRLAIVLVILAVPCAAQSKTETVANVGMRAFDAVQSCYLMHTSRGWRENILPTHSCAGVAGFDAGFAGGAFLADRWLARHGHTRLAHLQIVSAGGASVGVVYNFTGRH